MERQTTTSANKASHVSSPSDADQPPPSHQGHRRIRNTVDFSAQSPGGSPNHEGSGRCRRHNPMRFHPCGGRSRATNRSAQRQCHLAGCPFPSIAATTDTRPPSHTRETMPSRLPKHSRPNNRCSEIGIRRPGQLAHNIRKSRDGQPRPSGTRADMACSGSGTHCIGARHGSCGRRCPRGNLLHRLGAIASSRPLRRGSSPTPH
mmetsp:Transcript_124602/g.398513  ORF Transcript_124602/g.398513 Transcript_124602/m.398513 type:complete len:204 (-) Transcript_124602:413-1024(-)